MVLRWRLNESSWLLAQIRRSICTFGAASSQVTGPRYRSWRREAALSAAAAGTGAVLLASGYDGRRMANGSGVRRSGMARCEDRRGSGEGRRETVQANKVGTPADRRNIVSFIGYLRNPEGRQRPSIVIDPWTGQPDVELDYSREKVLIVDARPELAAGEISLDRTGSSLVQHHTALATEDFYTDAEAIRTKYYEEICRLVKEATGAETVVAIHHQIRNEARALELVGGDREKLPRYKTNSPMVPPIDGYAINAHADYSDKTAARTAREQLPHIRALEARQLHARGRYMMVNAWRNISDINPILDNHLAVLDGSTLSAEDIVLVDMHYKTFSTECAQVAHTAARRHRWLYFPAMRKNEVLLFKQYDSESQAQARYAVHCSVKDPSAPAETPARESIEVRTVAFFPVAAQDAEMETERVTKGLFAPSAFPLADEVARHFIKQLESPSLWPDDMRRWLFEALTDDADAAAETLMAHMIEWNADPENIHGIMSNAPSDLKSEVLNLLRVSDFKGKLRDNFGPRL